MNKSITSIEADREDPNQRSIFVNGTCVATVTASDIESLCIKTEQEWTPELDSAIVSMQTIDRTRSMALQLLSRRAWSKKELSDRLVKRGCDSADAMQVCDLLEGEGWLDDLSYAGALIRQWIRVEPASTRWLKYKLTGKGIDVDTATEAIREELGAKCEQDAATELAMLRSAKLGSVDVATKRRRVIGALQRRGFAVDVASEAFRRAT